MSPHDLDIELFYPTCLEAPPRGHETWLRETLGWAIRRRVVQAGSTSCRGLERMRSDLATALAYPGARGEVAQLLSDFIGWYLLLDDELESLGRAGAHLPDITRRFDPYLTALAGQGAPRPRGASGLLRGAIDLGARFCAVSSAAWRARFLESMRTYFHHGVLPEIKHRSAGTVPSMTEYTALRVDSSGAYPIFDLVEVASGSELPADIAAHPAILELRKVAAIIISWANDILSFHKERYSGHALTLPLLLMHHEALQDREALAVTARIHNDEMARYLRLQRSALGSAALDTPVVRGWLRGVEVVMRGLLEWQLMATRYTEGRRLWVRVIKAGAGAEGETARAQGAPQGAQGGEGGGSGAGAGAAAAAAAGAGAGAGAGAAAGAAAGAG